MAFMGRFKPLWVKNTYDFTLASAAGISSISLFLPNTLFTYIELEFSEHSEFPPSISLGFSTSTSSIP